VPALSFRPTAVDWCRWGWQQCQSFPCLEGESAGVGGGDRNSDHGVSLSAGTPPMEPDRASSLLVYQSEVERAATLEPRNGDQSDGREANPKRAASESGARYPEVPDGSQSLSGADRETADSPSQNSSRMELHHIVPDCVIHTVHLIIPRRLSFNPSVERAPISFSIHSRLSGVETLDGDWPAE
jgi:hypothetical protein